MRKFETKIRNVAYRAVEALRRWRRGITWCKGMKTRVAIA
jgi:hypothetical protein